MKTFNLQLLTSIVKHLRNRSFTQITCNYTALGVRSVVEDADGVQYEIHIKTINRNSSSELVNVKELSAKIGLVNFVENKQTLTFSE